MFALGRDHSAKLCNGLARGGSLTGQDWLRWRLANDAFDATLTDPGTVDASIFDRSLHPHVASWFKEAAEPLLTAHLDLLDKYSIQWVRLRSEAPGRVLYEDDDQVVVEPLPYTGGG